MGDEIFSVYLTPADYSKLAYAKLDLPASPWKLLDAMDKVRLPEGDSLYLEITDYRDFEVLRSSLVCSATNLLELNDLAERLSRLNEVQRIAFEGLVRVDFQKQESITLKRLRDLAESVDCCHVVESVVSDGQLGRFYAENGFVPEVEGMSDAAFELLDFEKVGKMAHGRMRRICSQWNLRLGWLCSTALRLEVGAGNHAESACRAGLYNPPAVDCTP